MRRLDAAAAEPDTPWPWHGPIPEVCEVARYGKPAVPLLVRHLSYGPDLDEYADSDLHVEQQVELALCMIFACQPSSGETVYGIRSFDGENRTVKGFWVARVREHLRIGQ